MSTGLLKVMLHAEIDVSPFLTAFTNDEIKPFHFDLCLSEHQDHRINHESLKHFFDSGEEESLFSFDRFLYRQKTAVT